MKKIFFAIILAVFLGTSCTNLDEKIYSQLNADEFYTNEEEMIMNVGRVYTYLLRYTNYFNYWGAITICSDEATCPYRETALWWDNGVWVDLHRQDFTSTLGNINTCWNFIFEGVTMCNQVIYQFEQSTVEFDTKPNLMAEVKIMRAWFYLNALDLFGNVPITTDFSDVTLPQQSNRNELFTFIEKETTDNVGLLQTAPNAGNYGRATQALAYTILAKLYLNASEWIGEAMWQKAIDACDKVINFGTLSLESDYFANFKVNNESSSENIFVMVYDNVYTRSNRFTFHQFTLHTLSQQTFGIIDFCWDGFASMEKFYNSYDDNDIRKKSWLVGPQFSMNGEPLMLADDRQLTYRPELKALYYPQDPSLLDDGVRFAKYEYQNGLSGSMSNDYVVYRYADILMMKGEALVRLGRTSEALPFFNPVRQRAGMPAYTEAELTLDEILAERGREFSWEGLRRQDLIRFGKFTEAWWEKEAKGDYVKLMPLPYQALDRNTNLKQNPGY